jgi:putative glycosyltransferase (TIGR04372 family)
VKTAVGAIVFRLAVLVCRALRVRFLVNPAFPPAFTRVGHLSAEPDCFIKEGLLGLRPRCIGVLLVPREKAANPCLLDYWRQRLWVVSSPFWVRVLGPLAEVPALRYPTNPYVTAINETATFGAIQSAYAGGPPVLRLTGAHRARGEAELLKLGVPGGAWIVAIHCREGGYDANEPSHRGRNASIEAYFPALAAVVERGGWCVRMGDPTMTPLPPMPGVIDYAHSPIRSDWMDVFLCARARFMLGSASGLCVLGNVFGTPCAVANQCLPALAFPYGATDLFIPKLLRDRATGRLFPFAEIAGGPLGNARFSHCLELARVSVEDNAPEDIRDLALEMLDELDGTFRETDEDRWLRAASRALLEPGHYTYGAGSRFGRLFLRKHARLFTEPAACAPAATPCGTPQCPCIRNPRWAARQLCTAPAPAAIGQFPRDIIDPALDSEGIHEDGWVAPTAHCVLTAPAGTALVLRGMLPQIGPQIGPPVAPELRVWIDGVEVLRQVLRCGAIELTCPVPPGTRPRRVELRFSETQRLPAPDTRTVGMHLAYLGFVLTAAAEAA